GQSAQSVQGTHRPHERDDPDAGVRRGRGAGTGGPAQNPRHGVGTYHRHIRQGQRSGDPVRARRRVPGGHRRLARQRRAEHIRRAQERAGGGGGGVLHPGALLRALPAHHQPARRRLREQDGRRVRERPAGDHHRGRRQPAGAPARPDPKPGRL
ncbi:MAG: hypothetical protein AVDCRST_MAG03-987, partial [uncultured Rubrobacteraceae bacterium]